MIPRIPFVFATGDTLTLEKIKANLLRLDKDFSYSADRNINVSQFIIPFTGVAAGTPQAASTYRFRADIDMVVVGTELQVHGAAATTTVAVFGGGTFIPHNLQTLAADPTNTRYVSYQEQSIIFGANNTNDFIVTASGNTTSIDLVVYYKQARYIKNELTATFNPELDSSTNLSTAATRLNSSLSVWGTRITLNQSNNIDTNYEIYRVFGDAASPLVREFTFIPCENRTISAIHLSNVAAVGTNLKAELVSAAGTGSNLTSITVNGAGATTFAESFNQTDAVSAVSSDDDFTDSAKDTRLQIVRTLGAATIVCAYVTIVYK
jgi:hypothetical protein